MAESEAQRRANLNYRRKNTKSITLTFFPSDMELYDYVASKGSKASYIKDLIRKDMESH